jgi:aminocarboxymuconate-semialdehyde decarboxylase
VATSRPLAPGARTIDVHAHAVLEATLDAAGALGPELGEDGGGPWFRVGEYRLEGVRYRGSAFMDVDLRLAGMQAAGIDFQVLSPNPLTYFHHVPAAPAQAYCRRHNDALADLVRAHPERLAGLAALPMQEPRAAAEELERAVRELGLLGACVGTDFGIALDAPSLDDFYATLTRLDVPLFLHPAPDGIDGPLRDARLRRFDLELTAGFAAEETLAVATLIYGGVLDRHPRLDVCVSHGGGATAFLCGRLAAAGAHRRWAPQALRAEGAFERRLRRLWFDDHVHDPRALALLVQVVGADRLVMGTNFAGWDQAATVRADAADGVRADNARRLLRLTAATDTMGDAIRR